MSVCFIILELDFEFNHSHFVLRLSTILTAYAGCKAVRIFSAALLELCTSN